ncbi:MAG: O-antigen ligase family protein [Candidatus Limnocylindria bacterium]
MILSVRREHSHAVAVAGIGVALTILMVGGAWIAWPFFALPGVLLVALVAYTAHRWPLGTLVVSTLVVLADPVIVRTVLPGTMDIGPIGASEPMIAVSGLVIMVDAIRRGTFWRAMRDPLMPLMILFVLVASVSAVVNAMPPGVAVLGVVMTVDAVAIYFLARMVPTSDQSAMRAVGAIVSVAFVAAVIGILQVTLHPDLFGFASFAGRFGEGGRITSFLGNPNMVAAVIGFTLPFPLLAARRLERSRERWIAFGVTTTFLLALLLTFSRGGWLAVVLGVIVTVALLDRRAIVTLGAAVVVAWLITVTMPRNLLVASEDLELYFPDGGAPSIIDSTLDRLDEVYERRDLRMRFIREGLPIIAEHPILGVGPGRYGGAASVIVPSPVYAEYGIGLYGFRTVHNFWLHLFGELGAIGGAVFVVAVLGLWLRFVKAARDAHDPRRFLLLAGTATAISIVTLNNMTEMVFEGNFPGFVIWLMVGIVSTMAPSTRIFTRKRRKPGRQSDGDDLRAPDHSVPGSISSSTSAKGA